VDFSALKMLKTILGLLLLVLIGQAVIVWQNERTYRAVVQESEVASQETEITVTPYGTSTPIKTKVTTTFREAPHTSETDDEWDARHIATCARIRAAWESAP